MKGGIRFLKMITFDSFLSTLRPVLRVDFILMKQSLTINYEVILDSYKTINARVDET